MNDRHEPTISSLPLDKEEPASPRGRPSAPSRTPPPVSARPVIVRSKLAPVALLFALATGVFAGFVYWQLQQTQQQLAASVNQMAQAEQRIADLEGRLRLAGDESSQSLTALQTNVKENSAEIRKLWGVAYDKNRKAIEALNSETAKLQKTIASLDSSVKKQVGDVTGELKVLTELMEGQQAVISRADRSLSSQAETLSNLGNKLNALDSELRRRVSANEEAIRAIDAFRVQVNRELINLRGGE